MKTSKYLGKTYCGYKVVKTMEAPGRHTLFRMKKGNKCVTVRDNTLTALSRHQIKMSDILAR